jgi:hypothetical protein
MRKAFLTICILLLPVHAAFAGQGWNVTFTNVTDKPATVRPSGETCWYWKQLESSFVVPPRGMVTKHTEAKSSGACSSQKSLAGVDIDLDGSPGSTHVELKGVGGDFGHNIKTKINCGHGFLGIAPGSVVGTCGNNGKSIEATLSIMPATK